MEVIAKDVIKELADKVVEEMQGRRSGTTWRLAGSASRTWIK